MGLADEGAVAAIGRTRTIVRCSICNWASMIGAAVTSAANRVNAQRLTLHAPFLFLNDFLALNAGLTCRNK